MNLAQYLPENHIIHNLKGKTKIEIIEELLLKMQELDLITDFDSTLNDILAREGYLSTGLENGLAIPHAKTQGTNDLNMVFGVRKEGVEFETLDNKPAQLIFLVLSPPNTSGPHIQALALITRNLKDATVRENLINAPSATAIAELFQSFN